MPSLGKHRLLLGLLVAPLACASNAPETDKSDSSVQGSGGASGAGSGGASGSSAGGGAGSDGSATSCQMLADEYMATLHQLKFCNALVDYECMETAWATVDCNCPTYINGSFSLERKALKEKLQDLKGEWVGASCVSDAACSCAAPAGAECSMLRGAPGGTCNDIPGGG